MKQVLTICHNRYPHLIPDGTVGHSAMRNKANADT